MKALRITDGRMRGGWLLPSSRMVAILLFLCGFLAGCAAGPRTKQEKVDWMFLFPEEKPFSFDTLYGSAAAFRALKAPERIEVYRISPLVDMEPEAGVKTILGHRILNGPVVPPDEVREEFAALFSARNTFPIVRSAGGSPAYWCGFSPLARPWICFSASSAAMS